MQILALSADDSRAKVEDFLATQKLTLDVAFGEQVSELMETLGVQSLPTEFFVDADSTIVFSLQGAASDQELDAAVLELVGD